MYPLDFIILDETIKIKLIINKPIIYNGK